MAARQEIHPSDHRREDLIALPRDPSAVEGMSDPGDLAIRVISFGDPGARPKAYLQAGLHADELPGLLVLSKLIDLLDEAAREGRIIGEIVVVPVANPIGLKQRTSGYIRGRNDFSSGENFNRGYANLAALIDGEIGATLTDNASENIAAIRDAMGAVLDRMTPMTALETMRHGLLTRAHDADIALDVHADNEALLHIYTGTPLWPDAEDLAAELDARAVLLAERSGGDPFDEACSAPWWELARKFPGKPIPAACLAATVELRSNNAVDDKDADQDARGLFRFLMRRGLIEGEAGGVPRLLADATALNAMQQLKAETEGLLIYHARLGDTVRAGDLIAEIINPFGGRSQIHAHTDGLLFARHDQRYAWPGKVIGKIAGRDPLPERVGDLLTP
ncbi:MAG: succinylglutamate desuccinylase/aspartoacylase family protein [Pseudomonadota bacterium]